MNDSHSKQCTMCPMLLTGRQQTYCSRECHNSAGNAKLQSYQAQQERAISRKRDLILRKGGACEICGYCKNIAALCFHHLDPTQKEFGLDGRKLSNSSMTSILQELAKCQLLCHNCHSEVHHTDEKFTLANTTLSPLL